MRATPSLAWNAIRDYYDKHKDGSLKDVLFDRNSKDNFINDFEDKYKEISKNYMSSKAGDLDRHKQAAILLHCTINNKLFKYNGKVEPGKIFVGCEQVGLLLSLSFMKDMLNNILDEIGEDRLEEYIFPKAFSCQTEYFDILTRDIYLQSSKDSGVYILFLSNILFFIEYNTLKELRPSLIDKIKKYTREQQQD